MTSPTQISKFALHRFNGAPSRYLRVQREDLTTASGKPTPVKSHLQLIFDRSGSMYGSIDEVKNTLRKILTLSEFNTPDLQVSLHSFSSSGDVKTHFKRVPVSVIMATSSAQLREIDSIRATSLTCIAQALLVADGLVDDGEVTAILVHTDGFANDPSPAAEARNVAAAVAKLKTHPRLFANTIAYGGWCDYNMMSLIANSLSGQCIQARDMRAVYDALHGTMSLLAGNVAPTVEVSVGQASYATFVSRSARKVLGSTTSLQVQGLAAQDDKTAYRYFDISKEEYEALNVPVNGQNGESVEPIVALARTQLAQGNIPTAKYAMLATRNPALQGHSKALVNSEIASFAAALETALFDAPAYTPLPQYGLTSGGPSVLGVLSVLNRFPGAVQVNLKALLSGYKRRGVKRIEGVRKDDGTVELPAYETRTRENPDGYINVSGFDVNRNTASVNMLVTQGLDLFPRGGSTRVASVKGVSLDGLKSFNNYTIVGDGSLNVQELPLRTNDKRLFSELVVLGAVTGDYVPNAPFTINLANLPLVEYDQTFDSISPDTFQRLARLMVFSKFLGGVIKGESTSLTADQIAELKTHYLTPALNFSPPTTTEYADLQEALATGKIDTRLSYKIDIGIPELTSVGKLKSGNEYLQRRFTATLEGKAVDKPTLDLISKGATFGVKKLTGATKLDIVDTLSYPIYEGLLGLGDESVVFDLLKGIQHPNPTAFLTDLRSGVKDKIVAALADTQALVDRDIEAIYDIVRPLAFYVGAAGMVPESLKATPFTADEFAAKYPATKLTKDEKEEGTFYLLPNGTVLTVYVKGEYFTV